MVFENKMFSIDERLSTLTNDVIYFAGSTTHTKNAILIELNLQTKTIIIKQEFCDCVQLFLVQDKILCITLTHLLVYDLVSTLCDNQFELQEKFFHPFFILRDQSILTLVNNRLFTINYFNEEMKFIECQLKDIIIIFELRNKSFALLHFNETLSFLI